MDLTFDEIYLKLHAGEFHSSDSVVTQDAVNRLCEIAPSKVRLIDVLFQLVESPLSDVASSCAEAIKKNITPELQNKISQNHLNSLVNSLSSSNQKVQEQVAGAIATICEFSSLKSAVAECGAIDILVRLISSEVLNIQTNAVRALGNIAALYSNCLKVSRAGALPRLVILLENSPPDLTKLVVVTIRNICSRQETHSYVLGSGAHKHLIKLLASEYTNLQRDAAAALSNLASSMEGKKELLKLDIFRPLTKMLTTNGYKYDVIEAAVATVRNLCETRDGQFSVAKLGFGHFAKLLSVPDEKVLENVCGAIRNITISIENLTPMADVGVIDGLKVLLESPNHLVQLQAVGAIGNIGFDSENEKLIIKSGVLPSVVNLLGSKNLEVSIAAAEAVRNLTTYDKHQTMAIELGALTHIRNFFDTDNDDAHESITGMLRNLSCPSSSKNLITPFISNIVQLLNSSSPGVQESCCAIIRNLAWDADSQKEIARAGAIYPIVNLINSSPVQQVLECATTALLQLAICEGIHSELRDAGVMNLRPQLQSPFMLSAIHTLLCSSLLPPPETPYLQSYVTDHLKALVVACSSNETYFHLSWDLAFICTFISMISRLPNAKNLLWESDVPSVLIQCLGGEHDQEVCQSLRDMVDTPHKADMLRSMLISNLGDQNSSSVMFEDDDHETLLESGTPNRVGYLQLSEQSLRGKSSRRRIMRQSRPCLNDLVRWCAEQGPLLAKPLSLSEYLRNLGFNKYIDLLSNEGITDTHQLLSTPEMTLVELGIKPAHVDRILSKRLSTGFASLSVHQSRPPTNFERIPRNIPLNAFEEISPTSSLTSPIRHRTRTCPFRFIRRCFSRLCAPCS